MFVSHGIMWLICIGCDVSITARRTARRWHKPSSNNSEVPRPERGDGGLCLPFRVCVCACVRVGVGVDSFVFKPHVLVCRGIVWCFRFVMFWAQPGETRVVETPTGANGSTCQCNMPPAQSAVHPTQVRFHVRLNISISPCSCVTNLVGDRVLYLSIRSFLV